MTETPSHRLFAAIYDPATWLAERTILRPHREYLVKDLDGRVLDLGAGTGAMFPYFAEAASSGYSFDVSATEADPHMRKQAQNRAERLDLDVDIRAGVAESLPYPDDSFDVVIASMVFCTIPDVGTAIDEIVRVLKRVASSNFSNTSPMTGGDGDYRACSHRSGRRSPATVI